MDVLTLDIKGVFLAFLMAAAMLYISSFTLIGLGLGLFFVVSMLYFLGLSAIATWAGMKYKILIRQYQITRGVKNVLANGLGPLVFVVLVVFAGTNVNLVNALVIGFVASVAAVTADKFSSEIGILDGFPVSVVSWKRVSKGVSGGVTLIGLLAGMLSAFFIGGILVLGYFLWFFPIVLIQAGHGAFGLLEIGAMVIVVTLSGLIGTVVDSFLGYYEERGIGNKYTSNFFCSIAGGLMGALLYLLIAGL